MTFPVGPSGPDHEVDPLLAELVEQLAGWLQAGVPVDWHAVRAQYPEHMEQLARLLPAVQLLTDLGRSTVRWAAPVGPLVPLSAHEPGTLGDFRIVREVGRGGISVVYEAEQISLRRRVALKVLPFAAALDPKHLQRFLHEAQAAAQLHHTHIVPVYAVGCERGVHYYAMQFIDGQSLAALIGQLREHAEGRMAKDEARESSNSAAPQPQFQVLAEFPFGLRPSAFARTVAQLGVQAAEALEYAHQRGVVHRNLKPANLLLDRRSHMWIVDFGLAHYKEHAGLTRASERPGSMSSYLSPEQAQGKRELLDHRTDIYALGATLYELLTLQPAFRGRGREELLRRVAWEEPRRPRVWDKTIPVELETIVLKAMVKEPEGRYGTAQELADDLRRYLNGQPIRARRPTVWIRWRKWAQRHPGVVRVVVVVVAGVLVGMILWLRSPP